MIPPQPASDQTTLIERLVNGGAGLARIEGRPVFIPGVCPGEEVRASIRKVKKDYSEGTLEEVLRSSPDRVTPPCPVAETCGGCQWQHLDYPAQIRSKEEILREDLLRLGKITEPNILPTVQAGEPFGYRTRIQLKVDVKKTSPETGFFASNSNRIIPIDFCPVSREPLNRCLEVWNKIMSSQTGPLPPVKEININLAPSTGEIQASYFIDDESFEKLQMIISEMRREIPELVSQVITTRRGKRRI
ncbi:MAG TPA: TRAM domain-containing protein, partial [Nitrospiria bacterium]